MYVADAKAAFAALGPRLAQIYGQGESPMTITAMNRAAIADAIARDDDSRLGSVGTAQLDTEVRIADSRRSRAPGGRDRRDPRSRPDGDARLLAQSGSNEERARERLAPYGRCRQRRRRRLPDAQGPVEGSHHQRRLQHLSARSGGSAPAPSRRGRGRGRRPRARRLGRGGRCLHRRRATVRLRATRRESSSARWTRGASIASRGSSGRRRTFFSPSCRRTIRERC